MTRFSMLGKLSLEVSTQKPEIRNLLHRAFVQWQRAIAATLRESIEAGELPQSAEPNALAELVLDSWEGAQVRARAEQSDKALALFFNSTFDVLLKTPTH